MASLRVTRAVVRSAPLPRGGAVAAQRSFQTSRYLAAGKESAIHNEGRAEEAEAVKQEQLRQVKQHGKAEWHDSVASDSESIVKADRGELKDHKSTIKELQHETAKVAQQQKKE